jgi:hypothetical protein
VSRKGRNQSLALSGLVKEAEFDCSGFVIGEQPASMLLVVAESHLLRPAAEHFQASSGVD